MAKPAIKNLSAFTGKIERAKKSMEGQVTAKYKRFVSRILEDLALNTPQWSGELAASWQVVVGSKGQASARFRGFSKADTAFEAGYGGAQYVLGDRPAMQIALMNNSDAISSIRWNSKVSIVNTNPTERFQAANFRRAENGESPAMRDENRPKIAGDFMGVQYVKQKWSTKNRALEYSK